MGQNFRWLIVLLFITSSAFGQSYLYHNEWIDYNKTYYKFQVMGFGSDDVGAPVPKGMVRIPYSTLAAAGIATTASQDFQLWRDGEEVPVYISAASGALGSNDYIEFFGEINNGKLDKELYLDPEFQLSDKWSLQTDTAAYFLTINIGGSNKRMVNAGNNVAANVLPAADYFMHTAGRYFRNDLSNGYWANLEKSLYSSSYDKGEGWVSRAIRPDPECGSASLPQGFNNLYPYLSGPPMTLKVNAFGDAQNSRYVGINLNGDSIATFQMDYINYVKLEQPVSVNEIASGNANFQIVNQSTYGCDEMRVAMIELTYPRIFNMGGDSVFNFSLDSSSTGYFLAITNFNNNGVAPVLYDIDNGKRYVADISAIDTIKVVLPPSAIKYNLVLTTQAGNYYNTITNTQTRNFLNFSAAQQQGNYLIISNPLIYGTGSTNYVDQYRQYRSSIAGGSFAAKVIDINELVDQFAWGIKKHPLSIKNFLRFAKDNFIDSPKYVFLIGKGVIYSDYRANESDPLADRLNLVPTWGSPASDNLLASRDFNAVPAIPIGRLSAVSPQEVGDYLLKVQQHDSAQQDTIRTLESKDWMKNVIQVAGVNDLALGSQLDGYLANYKTIISDTSFGANVISFSKTADPAGYPDAISTFKKVYENGASLVTYFGHSSSSSLDFNLDNPQTYNNQYKYPVFVVNGCSAGNNFLFEPDRLNTKSTISEKFILSPQRGAVGYLASTNFGIVNYLDLYTTSFYNALGKTKYGQSVGAVIKETINATLASTGSADYYSRVHAEQYAFHGDPAIMINSPALPDYVIEQPQISINPLSVSVSDSAFSVKVKLYNTGKATKDSLTIKILKETPDGHVFTIATKTFNSINNVDSITVQVPIVANRDKGLNKITAVADYNNSVVELSENNNQATADVFILEDQIKPIFPYNFSIISAPDIRLYASTVNPLDSVKQYLMEIDTTALFNSPFKIIKSDTSAGGVVQFDPGFTYQNGVTYYWRVSSADTTHPDWIVSSFVYKSTGGDGFQQGHLYQNLQSSLTRLSLDSTTRKYSFLSKLHNLFIINSVYPTSGLEDNDFSISVDGSTYIASACVGNSIIFNVFDPFTFQPWHNSTNPFGAGGVCDTTRAYNFEYSYTTPETRKNAMDFLDSIPVGAYVTARLILNEPYNSFAADWASDTAMFGHGNSLYDRLKQNGFTSFDSFYYARVWSFVYKKGDTSFKPAYAMSNGLYDRINLSVNCTTSNAQGNIASPVFGPAKQWKNVIWNGYSLESGNDIAAVNVYGVKADKTDTLLYTLDSSQHNFDISSVSAVQYPFMRLQMSNTDSITATPYQLTDWSLTYVPVPEGAIAPNLYLSIPDTVSAQNATANSSDTLKIGVAFKNVSKADFDSLGLTVILYDSLHNAIAYPTQKLHPLLAGDTLQINLNLDVSALNGLYNIYVGVNPNNQQPEQFSFNNFLYKYVFINNQKVLALTLLDFNAVLQGSNVKTSWSVIAEENTKQYEIQHSTNGINFSKIGTTAAGSGDINYTFIHVNAPAGKNYYRLKIINNDGSFTYSAVRLVTVTKGIVINVYPNPVRDLLNISVNRPDGRTAEVRITSGVGQQLWHQKMNGTMQVNMKNWASGMYIVQVDDGDSISRYKVQKQ